MNGERQWWMFRILYISAANYDRKHLENFKIGLENSRIFFFQKSGNVERRRGSCVLCVQLCRMPRRAMTWMALITILSHATIHQTKTGETAFSTLCKVLVTLPLGGPQNITTRVSVCLSDCSSDSKTTQLEPNFTKYFVLWLGPPFVWLLLSPMNASTWV